MREAALQRAVAFGVTATGWLTTPELGRLSAYRLVARAYSSRLRAIVLLNHRSRSGGRPPLSRVLRAFEKAGWEAEVWAGSGSGWTVEAARRAVDSGAEALFGAGGDGMLATMLPAVVGSTTALGVVPLGTGNVWARELGLPMEPEAAVTAQLSRPVQRVDIGRLNRTPFLVVASAGLDARIVEVVEANMKGLGQAAYRLPASDCSARSGAQNARLSSTVSRSTFHCWQR